MNSQNASVNLLGRGFSESGVSVAAAGEVNGDVNGGLGLSIEHLAAFAERFDAREARRAADAGFQHAAAPDGNGFLPAEIVNAAGWGVAADAAQFYIDDLAGADFDGGAGMLNIVNAFVKADGRIELALQRGVGVNVVVAQGLLDHDQVKGVELLQQRRVFQTIGGVGVHHQADAREFFAEGAGGRDVVARLDFYFDALVARG